ncbi:protein kinase [Pseudomonas sp. SG20056]|uniref:protein kinase domain-containing protein n=1 Tax=Pseudomonas sp. SG20056 TaxID=3074146 RepID=UPI00287F5EF2|nr:protein kinase [Pseudomonas sp. SG20056]WNF48429.1 protein kinase [Pseudomonas sp. SG20056]
MSTSAPNNVTTPQGVTVDGQSVLTPGFNIVREIGRGANAVVFEAVDELLSRRVALKIWNKRGLSRAQFETAKIAPLEHPLVVRTYQFNWLKGHAYAVMELVPGVSCKEWLKESQPLDSRISVWKLYSAALKYIYNFEETHGDPHVGNILVFPDVDRFYDRYAEFQGASIGVKIADMGTSKVHNLVKKMQIREAKIIWETAGRIFKDQSLSRLWFHPNGLSHKTTLNLLDDLCEFISFSSNSAYSDRASENASILANLIIKTPLFKLEEVFACIKKSHITTSERLARRINSRLFGITNTLDANEIINEESERAYAALREDFLKKLALDS